MNHRGKRDWPAVGVLLNGGHIAGARGCKILGTSMQRPLCFATGRRRHQDRRVKARDGYQYTQWIVDPRQLFAPSYGYYVSDRCLAPFRMAGALRCMARTDQANDRLHILDQLGKTVHPASCIYLSTHFGQCNCAWPSPHLYTSAAADLCLYIVDHGVRVKNSGLRLSSG